MSELILIPKKLRSAILFNVANDLILSFSLFFFPDSFIASSGWAAFDPFALRLIAGGLTAVAVELFLLRNGSAESVKSVLNVKVSTMGIGVVGVIIAMIQSDHQPIIAEWILFGGLLIPFIQLGYMRIQLGKMLSK
jgi:hypothetical protein